VRRHVKASSATSNARKGTRARFAVVAALALAGLVAFVAPASAEPLVTENYANFGPDGTESSDFERINGVAVDQATGVVYVLDGKTGALYKFEADGTPLNFTGSNPNIEANKITGLDTYFEGFETQIAVDPASHRVYVTEKTAIRAFGANGEPAEFTAGPGAGTNAIPTIGGPSGVAVDASGAIYVSANNMVSIYSSSGALLTTITTEFPKNLAVAPNGAVYVASTFSVAKFTPSQFPVTATTNYQSQGVLPHSSNANEVSVAVDPANGDIYTLETLSTLGGWIQQLDKEGNFLRFIAKSGDQGELERGAGGLAVVAGGEEFQLYVGNTETVSGTGETVYSKVAIFGEEIIVGPPAVRSTSVIDLNLYTAKLRAQVNPDTFASTYHFEYGLEDCAVSACTSTAGGTIPAGHRFVGVSEEIVGLQPGTTYHYRIVAKNSAGPPTEGPDKTFTTPVSGLGFQLGDHRAWEMISPSNKFGGKIVQGSQGVMQAAADGNGVVYQSVTSIEPNPDGSRAIDTSTVLARRGAGGWRSKDVTPPHAEVSQLRFGGDYKAFSPNLERSLFEQQEKTLLSPEASEETPYLRENTEPATYRPLVTSKEGYANVPEGTVFGGGAGSGDSPVKIVAADPSLAHPVVRSKTPLALGAAPDSLYMWSDGQLQVVSELPASEGGAVTDGEAGSGAGSIRNAVSPDGSRVFWSGGGNYPDPTALYVRDTVNQETGRLDVARSDASGEGVAKPIFHGASADGTVVFFADPQRLTVDASPTGFDDVGQPAKDLYRCQVGRLEGGELGCTSLVDLSAPIEGSGETAEVLGMSLALADDGSRAYFVATGVLDTTPNEAGETAVAGEPNLYLWEEGQGRRFIATLSEEEKSDWGVGAVGVSAARLSAAASPDGRYLAFMSERSLTGYDNRDAKSEEPLEEVFRYDAVEDHLDCVSCNPSGASPEGKISSAEPNRADTKGNWSNRWVAAILPAAQESELNVGVAFHQPRVVLGNGRVFFNAIDSLVSADSNGEWDVYQYEPTGVGDCTSTSEGAAIARSVGGCVSLLSSGTAEEEATFIDASESGDDVFFITSARLSVLDEDSELDVYDTRVDGVPATLPVINECLGEACQPPPNPPNDPTPASAAFKGSGNVPSERCPESKRKVIRAGSAKCVAKKHKKKHSHKKAKRAANKRRAGR
jgi:WD40-like Beta Propeller Repeat